MPAFAILTYFMYIFILMLFPASILTVSTLCRLLHLGLTYLPSLCEDMLISYQQQCKLANVKCELQIDVGIF